MKLATKKRGAEATFEPPLNKLQRVAGLAELKSLDALTSALDWLRHFRVRVFVPVSWGLASIIGKLIILSYQKKRDDGSTFVDWDCYIIRGFDWIAKKASFQQAYPPYTTKTITSVAWTLEPGHFVSREVDAKLKADDPTFLPWMMAYYPARPCLDSPLECPPDA